MCPEPALLVAYLDGTLFHRDARNVDEHVLTCPNCTALLADMRRQREAELRRSRRSNALAIGAAVTGVAVIAIGVWAVWPDSNGARSPDVAPARNDAPPTVTSAVTPSNGGADQPAVASTKVEDPLLRPAPVVQEKKTPTPPPKAAAALAPARATPKPKAAVTTEKASRAPEKPTTDAIAREPETPAVAEEIGIVLRGRNANRRFVWRVRDLAIEHSTDGGATWATELTADRPIRAGAFVNTNVAWLVGENGLVLRRTANGWFGASAPADGHIVAVRASSPSRATVTLDDGRVFTTENGGVTWSTP